MYHCVTYRSGDVNRIMCRSINKKQKEIIKEFSNFTEWFQMYQHIISLGRNIHLMDEKNEKDMLPGCQSQVWIKGSIQNGKMWYQAESDSLITKGILSLLLRIYNHQTPLDIVDSDLYFTEEIGLQTHLSPARANGLQSMINHMKTIAKSYL